MSEITPICPNCDSFDYKVEVVPANRQQCRCLNCDRIYPFPVPPEPLFRLIEGMPIFSPDFAHRVSTGKANLSDMALLIHQARRQALDEAIAVFWPVLNCNDPNCTTCKIMRAAAQEIEQLRDKEP